MQRRDFLAAHGGCPRGGRPAFRQLAQPPPPRRGRAEADPPERRGYRRPGRRPRNATFNSIGLDIARESLEALGLGAVGRAPSPAIATGTRGQDRDRAADINTFFRIPRISAVLPHPRRLGQRARLLPCSTTTPSAATRRSCSGSDDVTALLVGSAREDLGLVTFHGPNGMGAWDAFSSRLRQARVCSTPSRDVCRRTAHERQQRARRHAGAHPYDHRRHGARPSHRPATSRARRDAGSAYLPDWKGAILFLEDVREDIYRFDRMHDTLKLAGILDQIGGFVFWHLRPVRARRRSLRRADVRGSSGRITFAPLNIPSWAARPIATACRSDAAGGRRRGDRLRPPAPSA